MTSITETLIKKAKSGVLQGEKKAYKPYNETPIKDTIHNYKEMNFSKHSVEVKIDLLKSYFPELEREELNKVIAV